MTDRLRDAFETLATRGQPQRPDEFARTVLAASRGETVSELAPATEPGPRRFFVPALAAAAVLLVLAVAVVALRGGDEDSVRTIPPATQTTETTVDPAVQSNFVPSTPHVGPTQVPTEHCGRIDFTPNSDDAATNITARWISCDSARNFVSRVRQDHNYVSGARQFRVGEFECFVYDTTQDGYPTAHYKCQNPTSPLVEWDR